MSMPMSSVLCMACSSRHPFILMHACIRPRAGVYGVSMQAVEALLDKGSADMDAVPLLRLVREVGSEYGARRANPLRRAWLWPWLDDRAAEGQLKARVLRSFAQVGRMCDRDCDGMKHLEATMHALISSCMHVGCICA